jgi:hypothetical protein
VGQDLLDYTGLDEGGNNVYKLHHRSKHPRAP